MPEPATNALNTIWQKLANPSTTLRLVMGGFATVAGLTLAAKAVSFVKDAAVAHWFGVRSELDAFVLAFGLHSSIAATLATGLPGAMLPAYADTRHRLGEKHADRLALQSGFLHGLSLLVIGLLAIACADPIVKVMGHGFGDASRTLAIEMIGKLLPFLICYGMTTHLATWLRGRKLFVAASASQMAIPLVIIAMMFFRPSLNVLVLATNCGALLHFVILVLALRRQISLPNIGEWEPDNAIILRNTLPFLISGLVMALTSLTDQSMAGWLSAGSVTVLSYSDKVCGIVLALTALAASEALFPFFADVVAQKDWARLRRQVFQIIVVVTCGTIPLALLLSWQAPLVVRLLFERGEFTAEATARVAEVLRYAALQIPFYVVGVLLSRIVVSLQASGFSLALASVSLALNIALNAIFMQTMGVAGIALSTACVYLVTSIVLVVYVQRAIRKRTLQAS